MSVAIIETSTGNSLGALTLTGKRVSGTGLGEDYVLSKRVDGLTDPEIYEYYARGWSNGYVHSESADGVKDVHSTVAVHTVGYGIGTVTESQASSSQGNKRRRRAVRALAYRKHKGKF